MNDTYTIMVCADCFDVICGDGSSLDYYYDETEAETRRKEIDKGINEITSTEPCDLVCGGSGDDKIDFTNQSCDCCGSHLAGSRYPVFVLPLCHAKYQTHGG